MYCQFTLAKLDVGGMGEHVSTRMPSQSQMRMMEEQIRREDMVSGRLRVLNSVKDWQKQRVSTCTIGADNAGLAA